MVDRIGAIQARMRETEASHDRSAPAGAYLVARLDGRGFHRLTRDMDFEKPYDERFRDAMIGAARHLMQTGFQVWHAYTQSDEISLLFAPEDATFAHKHRKLLSVLAGEASASLALDFGRTASVDCRLLELRDVGEVGDYFEWRRLDAERNCAYSHAYWALRREGQRGRTAHLELKGLDRTEQERLVRDLTGIDYEKLPAWQKFGIGLYIERFEKQGVNPLTGEVRMAERRRIDVDLDLPTRAEYRKRVMALLS